MDDMLEPSEGESVAALPGPDGLRYRVWAPPGPPRATLAVLTGVMSNTAWFRPLAARWRARGYRVVGVERRGSGLNAASGRGDTPSAKVLVDDARAVVEHGRDPERPLVIVGWCWGAILGVHLGHALGDAVQGLALLTPGLYPSARVAERMKALAAQAAGQPAEAPVLDSPITDEMFTSGPALDGFVRRDDARWRRFSPRFLDVSSRLTMAARMRLRKLALPVFVALAEDDATVDEAATRAELARLPPDRLHTTSLPGAHGLQFEAPDALAERLDAWARDALGV
ncbi:MAG: alpha/beta fold hydrolase [Myxococcales bacterium]|nr:alpha/beta fold hydrolase [Myxococcales bacterium]